MNYQSLQLNSPDLKKVKDLLHQAFPEQEILPENYLTGPLLTHQGQIFAFYEKKEFIGFVITFTGQKAVYLSYFALVPEKRNRGYGSQILKLLSSTLYPEKMLFVDIEEVKDSYPDYKIRKRREEFYFRNGFVEADYRFTYRQENYIILSTPRKITEAEIYEVWNSYPR